MPAQKERKKKNRQNQKRNQNKPARPLNKERKKSARDSRPSQPAMRSTTKLGKNQSLSKLTLKFCKTTTPPLALHLTPIMKNEKQEREKKSDMNKKQMSHLARPNSSDPFMKKPCVYLCNHSFGEIHFSGPEKKEQLKTKKKV